MDCKPIRLVTHTTRFLRGTQVSRGPVGEAHGTGAPQAPRRSSETGGSDRQGAGTRPEGEAKIA